MQLASVIELLYLINIQKQNKHYLSMEDKTSYINVLGGEDAIADHFPSVSRKF